MSVCLKVFFVRIVLSGTGALLATVSLNNTNIQLISMYAFMYVCMYVYMYVSMYVCCIYVWMYVCVCVCMYVCT